MKIKHNTSFGITREIGWFILAFIPVLNLIWVAKVCELISSHELEK